LCDAINVFHHIKVVCPLLPLSLQLLVRYKIVVVVINEISSFIQAQLSATEKYEIIKCGA